MDVSTAEDIIGSWIVAELAIEVIIAFPSAPRPSAGQYAVINITEDASISTDSSDITLLGNESVDIVRSKLKSFFVSINIYRSDAFNKANILIDSLDKTSNIEIFNTGCLGIGVVSDARKLPVDINSIYEERGQFDINLYHRSEFTENLASIQKIELTNEIDGDTVIIENP